MSCSWSLFLESLLREALLTQNPASRCLHKFLMPRAALKSPESQSNQPEPTSRGRLRWRSGRRPRCKHFNHLVARYLHSFPPCPISAFSRTSRQTLPSLPRQLRTPLIRIFPQTDWPAPIAFHIRNIPPQIPHPFPIFIRERTKQRIPNGSFCVAIAYDFQGSL